MIERRYVRESMISEHLTDPCVPDFVEIVFSKDHDVEVAALAARVAATDRALQVERLKFDSAIKHLTAITGMLAPDNIKLPNGRVMEFAPPVESVMDYWRGLTAAIKAARDHVDSVRNAAADGEKHG